MTKCALLLAAVFLALPAALAGEGVPAPPAADDFYDDFLFDRGLTAAAETGAEKIPANPAAAEGLESREGWRLAEWEDKGQLAKLPDPNSAGNTLLRLATGGGKLGKSGAVIGNVMLPAETGFMTVSACNPGEAPVKIALGFFLFGEVYYETAPQELPPGGWKVLRFDLSARDFKTQATKWQHTTFLPKRVPVRNTVLLLFGEGKKAAVFCDAVSMDCLKLPELRPGTTVQLGKEAARSTYAGYVAAASAQGLTLVNDQTARPADRELRLAARSGGSTPEAWYLEFIDRSILRQLMPGDAVQVGWCTVGNARCVSWINLARQFPRIGRLAGRVRSADQKQLALEIELTAVPAGFEYMTGKVLLVRIPPKAAGAIVADPERAAQLKRAKPGVAVEVEYEHTAEYGVLARTLKLPGAEAEPPSPPPPHPPDGPKEKEPVKPGGDSDF
jgi:hypothetical protein